MIGEFSHEFIKLQVQSNSDLVRFKSTQLKIQQEQIVNEQVSLKNNDGDYLTSTIIINGETQYLFTSQITVSPHNRAVSQWFAVDLCCAFCLFVCIRLYFRRENQSFLLLPVEPLISSLGAIHTVEPTII